MVKLLKSEQETIINFNKMHDEVYIFTYEKRLQRSIGSKSLGELVLDNGHGGKEYVIPYRSLRIQLFAGGGAGVKP